MAPRVNHWATPTERQQCLGGSLSTHIHFCLHVLYGNQTHSMFMKKWKRESWDLSLSLLPTIATILNFSLNLPTMVNCYCLDRWYTFTLLKRYVVLFWKMKQDHRRWRYHRRLLDYQSPYFKSFLIIKYLGIIKFFWIIKDSISIGKYFLIRLSSKRIRLSCRCSRKLSMVEADFQSGSRVLEKVFWTFSYLYLWYTMWFHAEKLLKTLKFWK